MSIIHTVKALFDGLAKTNKMARLLRQLCLLGSIVFLLPTATLCAQNTTDSSWQLDVKLKTLFNSHTSYEFGNPVAPYQEPLSRLEFPLDSVWGGLVLRKQHSRFSIGAEFLTTGVDQEAGHFKDTDWDDRSNPSRITSYGETGCRITPSYQASIDIDMSAADLLRLPSNFDLRPVVGFRWQQLSFVGHGGTQADYSELGAEPTVQLLSGDVIDFEQNWYQFHIGMKFGYQWQHLPTWLPSFKLHSQLDWSYVAGDSHDKHLLQTDHQSTTDTSGEAWHASLGLIIGLTKDLNLRVDGDYLNLKSTGTYRLNNGGVVTKWNNGVKVWSRQLSLSVALSYNF